MSEGCQYILSNKLDNISVYVVSSSRLGIFQSFYYFQDLIRMHNTKRKAALSLIACLSLLIGSASTSGMSPLRPATLPRKKEFMVPAMAAGELIILPLWNSLEGGPELFQFSHDLTFFHRVLGSFLVLLSLNLSEAFFSCLIIAVALFLRDLYSL